MAREFRTKHTSTVRNYSELFVGMRATRKHAVTASTIINLKAIPANSIPHIPGPEPDSHPGSYG